MNLPPMSMSRGAFANPNLAPSGENPNAVLSGATADGGSFFGSMQRHQHAANTAQALAQPAASQLREQQVDAMRQMEVAANSGAHLQNQALQGAAADLATRHALNAMQQGGLPMENLKRLAMMTRQLG